jgi:hypothetical protein
MSGEHRRIWKEAVVSYFRELSWNSHEETEKINKHNLKLAIGAAGTVTTTLRGHEINYEGRLKS